MKRLILFLLILVVGLFWDWILSGAALFVLANEPVINGIALFMVVSPFVVGPYFIYKLVMWLRLRAYQRKCRRAVNTNV